MNELISKLGTLLNQAKTFFTHLNLPSKQQKILELQDQMQQPDFWNNPELAQKISQEQSDLTEFVAFWEGLEKSGQELLELLKTNHDESEETMKYLTTQVADLEAKFCKNRLLALLSKKYDDDNAIFSIHAGAGGTDAQDWTEMLLRMLLRYSEKKNFKTDIVEQSRGGEAGLKSVTVHVKGRFAYGLLKSEAGVHRLVRQSPFNPAHTRETSFALVELIPELEEKESLSIDPKDIDIEANTSSGHGGQSVNTTYSAIRVTHKPTGIRVSIQNERSQAQNKELALKILMGKLQALEDQKLQEQKKELRGEFKSAEWGSQIRSYVLHPYKMVKDHRTDFTTSDPESVLDGDLDAFVEAFLERKP